MRNINTDNITWGCGVAGLLALVAAACADNGWIATVGVAAVCFCGARLAGFVPRGRLSAAAASGSSSDNSPAESVPAGHPVLDGMDTGALAENMLRQGRYALLLRPQIVTNLSADQRQRSTAALEKQMALVPEGEVLLSWGESEESEDNRPRGSPPLKPEVALVRSLFLDRYPVTNRQFQEFVSAGGYQQMALWDQQVLPAVLDFVDKTGQAGPSDWEHGRFPAGKADYPVVGVSWYEAAAYARWVGKRLPSQAEWIKAASWPVPIAGKPPAQRKFPWGDSMDRQRCNLWGSGPDRVVPVTEYPNGASVGGVYQLIGNVWEWTTGNFGAAAHYGHDLLLPVPMKSLHGGAFDTYFERQATCHFASGENPLARKRNIGFRCALSVCDLAMCGAAAPASADQAGPSEPPAAEVVTGNDEAADLVEVGAAAS